jgi:hypothetical protein
MNGSDGLRWRKSTFSGANGGGCVEVADHNGMILVRDTKEHGRGPVHRYTPEEWRAFIAGVRNGEFDLDRPYVIFYSGVTGADLGFCCLIGPGGDLRSWLRWLRCVEAERDRLAEQLEYAALFRGRC